MCKNGLSGPEYNHLDREQHGKLKDNVDIKPGGTWDSRHQKRNLSRRLIITITVCDIMIPLSLILRDTTWLPTQERRMQDQSYAIYG